MHSLKKAYIIHIESIIVLFGEIFFKWLFLEMHFNGLCRLYIGFHRAIRRNYLWAIISWNVFSVIYAVIILQLSVEQFGEIVLGHYFLKCIFNFLYNLCTGSRGIIRRDCLWAVVSWNAFSVVYVVHILHLTELFGEIVFERLFLEMYLQWFMLSLYWDSLNYSEMLSLGGYYRFQWFLWNIYLFW